MSASDLYGLIGMIFFAGFLVAVDGEVSLFVLGTAFMALCLWTERKERKS